MEFPVGQRTTYHTDLMSHSLESQHGLGEQKPFASRGDRERDPNKVRDSVEMANRVKSRLESRLIGRIRKLSVHASGDAVVLAGQCSTYYTKQLAQHIAMAVLEYEQLVNNIDVMPAK